MQLQNIFYPKLFFDFLELRTGSGAATDLPRLYPRLLLNDTVLPNNVYDSAYAYCTIPVDGTIIDIRSTSIKRWEMSL